MYSPLISPEHAQNFRQAVQATASEADRSKLGYVGLIGTSVGVWW